MNQKEITLLLSYIYNNTVILEEEVKQRQSDLRYRSVTVNDCIELACAIQRLESFKDITSNVRHLLSLYPDDKKGGETYEDK